ncbi:MAG: ACT domain-containing protein [Pyrobaculum sp.]|jgi:acetolactate synthase II small subunit
MKNIRIVTYRSVDSIGRVIAIVRRAKISLKNLYLVSEDSIYRIDLEVEGPVDEVRWLIDKLDKLPEVLKIEEININP